MSRGAHDSHDISVHAAAPREYLAIGIPSFGMVHLFFMTRMLNLRLPMNTTVRWFYVVNKEVGDARNEIVATALGSEAKDGMRCRSIFFVDDDVLLNQDALLKLVSHQRPIISGLYFAKTSVPQPLALHDEGDGVAREWLPGETIDVAGHGMGCCLIDADVFRRLRDETDLGVDRFGFPCWFKTVRDEPVVEIPGAAPDLQRNIRNQTEDMYFLTRARALGYQPAVDTSPQTFAWHLDTKKVVGYPLEQWQEWHETGRITWPHSSGSIVWQNVR